MKSHRHLLPTLLITLSALLLGSLLPLSNVLSQDGQPPAAPDTTSPNAVDGRPFAALSYQGNLNRGDVPYTGICDFRFTLWPVASGGRQIGLTQNSTDIQVTDGVFTTLLLFGITNGFIVGGENHFVQTEVKCQGDSDFTRLSPRQNLRPAPSALTLQPGAEIVDRSIETGVDALHVVQTTLNSQAIHGEAIADGSIGVWGEGVNNTGVYGLSQGGTGVWGQSTDANTVAVKGIANATGSVGVWGESAANTGVYGQSDAAGGAALWGKNTAGGVALKAEGNVVQSYDKGGVAKAMVHVVGGAIVDCYNGVTGATITSNSCGMTVVNLELGVYNVDVGFPVAGRFPLVQLDYGGIDPLVSYADLGTTLPDTINVIFLTPDDSNAGNANFWLLLF